MQLLTKADQYKQVSKVPEYVISMLTKADLYKYDSKSDQFVIVFKVALQVDNMLKNNEYVINHKVIVQAFNVSETD